MRVGANCQEKGFRDGAASIAQDAYHLKFEKGWPAQFEAVIIEDTIAVGAPRNDTPDVVGRGTVKAGLTHHERSGCSRWADPRVHDPRRASSYTAGGRTVK